MSQPHCIFAWTGPTPPEGYPPFVNISRDENGYRITVRAAGDGGRQIACTPIPPEALDSLIADLAEDLCRDGADRLMAMTEDEIDAELRSMGLDPAETAERGKQAVERALAAIRAKRGSAATPGVEGSKP